MGENDHGLARKPFSKIFVWGYALGKIQRQLKILDLFFKLFQAFKKLYFIYRTFPFLSPSSFVTSSVESDRVST